MKKLIVNDTNMFIDLMDIGLLDKFFRLPWEIRTTDFVMSEMPMGREKEAVNGYANKGKLHIAKFEYDEIMEINRLHKRFASMSNVSMTDFSAWYYAKRNGYALLTGDRKLRNAALCEGVEVHGIMYVIDSLVESDTISASLAYGKLLLLQEHNHRLPYNEIEKRLKLWEDEQKEEGGSL